MSDLVDTLRERDKILHEQKVTMFSGLYSQAADALEAKDKEIERLKEEIQKWETADSKAVADLYSEIDRLREELQGLIDHVSFYANSGVKFVGCGWCEKISQVCK